MIVGFCHWDLTPPCIFENLTSFIKLLAPTSSWLHHCIIIVQSVVKPHPWNSIQFLLLIAQRYREKASQLRKMEKSLLTIASSSALHFCNLVAHKRLHQLHKHFFLLYINMLHCAIEEKCRLNFKNEETFVHFKTIMIVKRRRRVNQKYQKLFV